MRKPMTKAQARLFQVNKAHDAAHLDINNGYRKLYIETARAMGLALPTSVAGHLAMPEEFHEEMADAQKNAVGGLMLAQEARRSSTRDAVRAQSPRR